MVQWEGMGADGLRALGLDGTLAGRAEGTWRGPRPEGLALVAEILTRPLKQPSSGSLPLSGRSELRVREGAWTLSVDHAAGNDLRLSGTAGGCLVGSDPLASTLSGDLRLEAESLALPALRPWIASGRGRVEATLGGTLGAPRATGTLHAFGLHAPTLAEARADLAGRFEADTKRLRLSGLEVRAGETTTRPPTAASGWP